MDNLKRQTRIQLNTFTLQEYGLQLDADVRRGEASRGGMFSVYFVICVIIFCLLVLFYSVYRGVEAVCGGKRAGIANIG